MLFEMDHLTEVLVKQFAAVTQRLKLLFRVRYWTRPGVSQWLLAPPSSTALCFVRYIL